MVNPRMRRTRLETALILVAVILSGLIFWVLFYQLLAETHEEGLIKGIEVYQPYMFAEIIPSIIAWILLPKAISHHPDEYRTHNPIPETTGTLIAGFIVVVCSALILAIPASLVALVGSFTLSMVIDPEWTNSAEDYVVSVVAIALAAIPALLVGQYRSRRREATRLMRAEAETARADERARIARDMHDTLSHRLSLIAVHAGVLEQQPDLPNRAEVAGTIKDQSAKAVEDLSQVLNMLREADGQKDPATAFSQVIEEARAAGQDVRLATPVEQVPQDLPTTVHHLFHRTLTEGLTNARKHAPGAPVTVSITGKELTVVTETAGTQEKPGKPGAAGLGDGAGVEAARGAGLGLVGVRERARLLGATVEVTDQPHTLKVSLP
ncbi:sensor histidine kinase [Corynebacterium cystitidis]|uniref:sensor histidine kinase n=1 Tax=Corynebacterium cystitidis TaxID=35757 RepID=UPI00211E6458|nr:histidine kinase [Corynebacterium cystitidis]